MIGIILLAFMIGCAPRPASEKKIPDGTLPFGIEYFDHEGIRCYTATSAYGMGISCLRYSP